MIDMRSVTSLHDKKSRRGKRRHQSIQPLRRGAQRRGDALSHSEQPRPRSDAFFACASLHSKPTAAPRSTLDFFFFFASKDVQPRCRLLRSLLPTRVLFLIDALFFFPFPSSLLSPPPGADQDLARITAGENMCKRRSAKGTGCLWSPREKQRGLNTN